jgi:MFS family permease
MNATAASRPPAVWRLLLPHSATPDARLLLAARALRGFADGCVSILLASYLSNLGFSPLQIGAIVTGTLLGSAALTLATGLLSHHLTRKRVLLAASVLMLITGLGFAGITAFWPLLIVAVVGTLNPSAGDVSVFLPTEQALLPDTVSARDRTAIFARYQLSGSLLGALGALASGIPVAYAMRNGIDLAGAQRSGFVLYALIAIAAGFIYSRLSPSLEARSDGARQAPLAASRGIVLKLAATFSLDAWGGGFTVQSLVALWLFRRFDLSPQVAGAVFFGANLVAAFSQLIAPRIAARFGLINTMVFTHIPSNLFRMLAALMPNAPTAVAMLLISQSMSQMDIAPRQTYVMSIVPPEERAAAASVTNVPRSLAQAASPLLAGALLSLTSFGWPLIIGGGIKIVYDLLLLAQFRSIHPPD